MMMMIIMMMIMMMMTMKIRAALINFQFRKDKQLIF